MDLNFEQVLSVKIKVHIHVRISLIRLIFSEKNMQNLDSLITICREKLKISEMLTSVDFLNQSTVPQNIFILQNSPSHERSLATDLQHVKPT